MKEKTHLEKLRRETHWAMDFHSFMGYRAIEDKQDDANFTFWINSIFKRMSEAILKDIDEKYKEYLLNGTAENIAIIMGVEDIIKKGLK